MTEERAPELANLGTLADMGDPKYNEALGGAKKFRFTLGRSRTVWDSAAWSRSKNRVRIGRNDGERRLVKSVKPERIAKVVMEGGD